MNNILLLLLALVCGVIFTVSVGVGVLGLTPAPSYSEEECLNILRSNSTDDQRYSECDAFYGNIIEEEQQQLFDAGCKALAWNQYDIVTNWKCPDD